MVKFKRVKADPFHKTITISASKSSGIRALILAAIKKYPVTIYNLPKSSDFTTLVNIFEILNLKIQRDENSLCIINSFPECENNFQNIILQTGDGGTTNRFLLAFLARGKNKYLLNPHIQFRTRPMEDLLCPLKDLGIKIEGPFLHRKYWLTVQGPYRTTEQIVKINCLLSTQFVSSCLLSLHDRKHITVKYSKLNSSHTYLKMTLSMIKNSNTSHITIPPDFSSMSYPLVLGALSRGVIFKGIKQVDPLQADSILIEILKQCGVNIKFIKEDLVVQGTQKLHPLIWDCSSCPDLVPALSVLCSFIEGKNQLNNIGSLKYKECDRIVEIKRILEKFQVSYRYDDRTNSLMIEGNPSRKISSLTYRPPQDHRMIMIAYLFMRLGAGGKLFNFEYVNKSFSNFYEVME